MLIILLRETNVINVTSGKKVEPSPLKTTTEEVVEGIRIDTNPNSSSNKLEEEDTNSNSSNRTTINPP